MPRAPSTRATRCGLTPSLRCSLPRYVADGSGVTSVSRRLPGAGRSGAGVPVAERSGPAAMSTSLGSNTYNRQNWEDAVSPGERPGQALRPPAAGRVSGWGAGQGREAAAEAALGAGRAARGEPRRGCRGSPGPEDGAPCPVLPALRRGLGCSGTGEALRQLRGLIWARRATFFSAEASPGWAQCRQ